MEAISTEQVKALDAHIPQTESYKKQQADIEKLKENDAEIIKELDNLNHGQEKLEEKVDAGFEKGRVRMDGIERMIIDSDKKRDEQHTEIKQQIQSKEMGELKAEIRKRNEKDEKDEAKQWDLVKIVSAAVVGVIVTFLGIKLLGGQ